MLFLHTSIIRWQHVVFAVCWLFAAAFWGLPAQAQTPSVATLAQPYVFTDEKAVVQWPQALAPVQVEYSLSTTTRAGVGPGEESVKAAVHAGRLEVSPRVEGIHLLQLHTTPPQTLYFLAITPPPAIPRAALEKALARTIPRSSAKLLGGRPFRIFSMGDSVANTGDYETLLAMMLRRATGNNNITVVDRTYAGRSIDATVRFFERDVNEAKPDLGLLMYGLNEQIVFYPLEAYLEQYEWVAGQLARRNADTIFLQPTPHILLPAEAPWYPFRTIGFAESIRPVAAQLNVPLVESFNAVWGIGGTSVADAVEKMRPVYPPAYHRQMESLLQLENTFDGDTIHPNVLGHLSIARAVFDTMMGQAQRPPLQLAGTSRWTPQGVVSDVAVRNVSGTVRSGKLEIYPPAEGIVQAENSVTYSLQPGQEIKFPVAWPGAQAPADLLKFPNDIYLAPGRPLIPIVDYTANGSRVYAAPAPFELDANWARGPYVVEGNTAKIGFVANGKRRDEKVVIPRDSEVGRIPLIKKIENGGKTGWAVAELAYVRYGQALRGEATLDGDLTEWQGHTWSSVGGPTIGGRTQARWVRGPQDNRASAAEAAQQWAFKSGKDGIYFACRVTGDVSGDGFTLFFDPRPKSQLGTVGPYYWATVNGVAGGSFKPDGTIEIGVGETSRQHGAAGMRGVWKATPNGRDIELFVPYALFEASGWPASGDLGLSIWWVHKGADGQLTNLMWSENGHPWNPRWYGVVRLAKKKDQSLPFMVRVR